MIFIDLHKVKLKYILETSQTIQPLKYRNHPIHLVNKYIFSLYSEATKFIYLKISMPDIL